MKLLRKQTAAPVPEVYSFRFWSSSPAPRHLEDVCLPPKPARPLLPLLPNGAMEMIMKELGHALERLSALTFERRGLYSKTVAATMWSTSASRQRWFGNTDTHRRMLEINAAPFF